MAIINYLLSVENLKKKGLIHQNTDTKILGTAIIRVQDMIIQPVLGSPLFRALLLRTQNDNWSATYRTLMDEYVTPALVSAVDYKASLLQKEKITNKTTGHISDEFQTTATKAELISFRAELQSDADFYLERLIGFLKDDCGDDYPEYTEAITRTNHDLKKVRSGYAVFKTWMT